MKTSLLLGIRSALLAATMASAHAAPDILIEGWDGLFWQNIDDNDLNPNQQVTDFDTVDYNSFKDRTYRIRNQNGDALTVFVNANSPSSTSSQFTFPDFPSGTFTVPGNGNREFVIRYTPQTSARTATIRIDSNDPDAENVYEFAVQGAARGGEISVHYNPTSGADVEIADGDTTPTVGAGTDFGTVSVGNQVTRSFYIRNDSTADPLTLDNPRLTGSGAAHFQIISLGTSNVGTGGTRNFQLRFEPTSAGVKTATFQIDSNDPDESPYNFTLTGEGTAFPEIALEGKPQATASNPIPSFDPIADGDITPQSNNGTLFDDTTVGTDRDTTIRITNSGNAALTLGTPSFSGTGASSFSAVGLSTASLAAGATREFTLRFSPVSAGTKTATFSMTNGDSNESPYNFTISGLGRAPEMDLTGRGPDNVFRAIADGSITTAENNGTDFGDTNVTGTKAERVFRITNNGNQNLNISGRNFSGAGAGDYSVSDLFAGNPFVNIAPGATQDFTITFDPSVLGPRPAVFSIDNNDPDENPYNFALNGTGIGFPEIRIQGRQTAHPGNPAPTFSLINDGDTTPTSSDGTLFRDTAVGDSFDMLVRVHNDGDGDLTFSSPTITGSSDFSVVSLSIAGLAAGASRDFTIRFRPSSFGAKTATFSLPNNDSNENPYNFSLQGTGLAPEIRISGRSVSTAGYDNIVDGATGVSVPEGTDFGTVRVSAGENENEFRISNDGNDSLNISNPRLTGAGAAHFSFKGVDSLFNIAVGNSRDFTITFDPSVEGTHDAVFLIDSNDPDERTYSFALRGVGFGLPKIRVQGRQTAHPLNLVPTFSLIENGDFITSTSNGTEFRDTDVGDTFDMLVRVHNDGDAALTFPSGAPVLAKTGGESYTVVDFDSAPVAPGEFREFRIRFAPTFVGADSDEVTIVSNDGDESVFTFHILGFGTGPEMEIRGGGATFTELIADGDTTPSAQDGTLFGEVNPTGGSLVVPFQIVNNGNKFLNITGKTVTGPHAADFTIRDLVTSPLPKSIAPNGGTWNFAVEFNPSASGVRSATISLTTNDSATSPYTFAVSGTGQNPAATPVLVLEGNSQPIANGDATPRTLDGTDFGTVVAGSGAVTRNFVIRNTGNAPLEIYAATTNSALFTAVAPSPATIAAGASRTFAVTLDPGAPGLQGAVVTLYNNDPLGSPWTFAVQATVQGSATPLAVTGVSANGSNLTLTYTAPPGTTYSLRRSTTLAANSWATVAGFGNLAAASTPASIVITNFVVPGQPAAFFRLEANP